MANIFGRVAIPTPPATQAAIDRYATTYTNTKAVVPLTAHAGGWLRLVGTTRAAVCPMRNYVYRLVTTSFRPIIPLSLPGPKLTHL